MEFKNQKLRPLYLIKAIPVIISTMLLMKSIPTLAVVHGDIELLRTTAMQHKSNKEALLTWKGEAIIHDTRIRGDTYYREHRNVASFAYRRVPPAVRWNKQTTAHKFVSEGKEYEDIGVGYNAGMLKEGRFFSYVIPELEKDKEDHSLIIFDVRKAYSQMDDFCFDPTHFLRDHREDITDLLLGLYKFANDPNLIGDTFITRDGDLVTVETRWDKGRRINGYIFDLSKGGNMVWYYATAPDGKEDWKYEFEEKDGVWVLKTLDYEYTCPGPVIVNGKTSIVKTTRKKQIKWVDNIVNAPLEPDEFSLKKLGIKPGDWVNDMIKHTRFKYTGEGQDL